jgi:SulP family sulfate permease
MPLRYAILDFRGVSDLDSSAVFGFVRMRQLAAAGDVHLIFTNTSPGIRRQLEKGGLGVPDDTVFSIHPDLDHGLEWCENEIISDARLTSSGSTRTLIDYFDGLILPGTDTAHLLEYLEKQAIKPGDVMIRQGDPPDVMYFIESGRVTARLELSQGRSVRLRSMGSGTVVGEIGLYLEMPRTATVVADQPGVVYCLTAEALHQMALEAPGLAAAFHHFMVRLLAERLLENNTTLNALLD